MMFGVFYSTTAKGHISFPLYLLIILGLIIISVGFVLKVGINGYYRFFQQQSAINKMNRKLDFIIKHMNLEYKDEDDK